MGRLFWMKSRLNEVIAGYLKSKYPNELDVNTTGNVIVIEIHDTFTLKKEDLVAALKIYGYPDHQARRMIDHSWGTFILNYQGLVVEKFTNDEIVLRSTKASKMICLRLPYELYERLKKKADEERKTMTDIVIDILKNNL